MAIRSLYLPQEPVILENYSNELCMRLIHSTDIYICIYESKGKKLGKKQTGKQPWIISNYLALCCSKKKKKKKVQKLFGKKKNHF